MNTTKKLLFIIPPYLPFSEYIPNNIGDKLPLLTAPYGVLSMVAYIKKFNDCECEILDLNKEILNVIHIDHSVCQIDINIILSSKIKKFNPDYVCISALFNTSFPHIKNICETIRKNSSCTILAGGGLPTNLYTDVFKEAPEIDALCFGEGELPLNKLLLDNGQMPLEDIFYLSPAWVTKKSLEKGIEPEFDFIDDLDEISVIDFSYIPLEKYNGRSYIEKDSNNIEMSIHTTRGCNFKCLSGDTLINTLSGKISIRELYETYVDPEVLTYHIDDRIALFAGVKTIEKTGENEILVRVHYEYFKSKKYIDCTPDHIFLTVDGREIEACQLNSDSILLIVDEKNNVFFGNVISVDWLEERGDTYCIEVPGYGWFFANDVLVHNCVFCSNYKIHGHKIRKMSNEKVLETVNYYIENHKMDMLLIEDDHFLFNKERAIYLLGEIAKLKVKIEFPNGIAVYKIDDDISKALFDAGVKMVPLAIESGSDYVLKEIIQKPLKVPQIYKAVKSLHKYDILIHTFVIIGFPNEHDEHRKETLDMLIKAEVDWVHVFIVVPIAGSRLYQQCKDNGYLLTEDYNKYTVSKCNIKAPGVEPEQIQFYAQYMNQIINFLENSNFKKGKYDICLRYFQNVVNHYPTQAIAHYMLCKIYNIYWALSLYIDNEHLILRDKHLALFNKYKEIEFYKNMINKLKKDGYKFD